MGYGLKLLGAAIAGVVIGSAAAAADPIEDFYKGKQINWILSAGAGGGYSTYAFAFAPYFSEHIPGQAEDRRAEHAGRRRHQGDELPDGRRAEGRHDHRPGAFQRAFRAALRPRRREVRSAQDELDRQHRHRQRHLRRLAHLGHQDWNDLMTKEFVVGTSGAGSQMETLPTMLNRLFGTKIKIISGYKGGNEVFLAMERGEVMGRCGGLIASMNSTRPDWLPQKKVTIPIQFALERNARNSRTCPRSAEFAKDEKTKQILALIFSPQAMDRPVLLPPGMPADKVAALRKAFKEAVEDPRLHRGSQEAEARSRLCQRREGGEDHRNRLLLPA